MTGVRVGDYYIVGGLAGYVSPYDYGANAFQEDAMMKTKALDAVLAHVLVLAGKTVFSDLTLFRGASLEGTVRYDDGAPAINLPVNIWFKDAKGRWARFNRNDVDPDLLPLGLGSRTDDKGRFREAALPPGSYCVEISLPNSAVLPSTLGGAQSLRVQMSPGDALKFYSGDKTSLEQAVPLELREGEERNDISMTLGTSGLYVLAGTIRDGETNVQKSALIRLVSIADPSVIRDTEAGNDGHFQLNYVPAGSYEVHIEDRGTQGQQELRYKVQTSRLVVTGDLTNLDYKLEKVRKDLSRP